MGAARGDQILVSNIVRELVAGKDYRFTSQGSQELKGLQEPIHIYELDWSDDSG